MTTLKLLWGLMYSLMLWLQTKGLEGEAAQLQDKGLLRFDFRKEVDPS